MAIDPGEMERPDHGDGCDGEEVSEIVPPWSASYP